MICPIGCYGVEAIHDIDCLPSVQTMLWILLGKAFVSFARYLSIVIVWCGRSCGFLGGYVGVMAEHKGCATCQRHGNVDPGLDSVSC